MKAVVQKLGHGVNTLSSFTERIGNIVYASIHKYLWSFQSCFGVLSRLCQEKD